MLFLKNSESVLFLMNRTYLLFSPCCLIHFAPGRGSENGAKQLAVCAGPVVSVTAVRQEHLLWDETALDAGASFNPHETR